MKPGQSIAQSGRGTPPRCSPFSGQTIIKRDKSKVLKIFEKAEIIKTGSEVNHDKTSKFYQESNRFLKHNMNLIFFLIIFAYIGHAFAGDLSRTKPHPSLSAKDVVQIVMNALKNNDTPTKNRGVVVTFNFSSPANKQHTGPLERFNIMIRSKTYSPMINHRKAVYEKYNVEGLNASIDVILISARGKTLGYRFRLSKQTGNLFNGSWMADSVMPIQALTI